MGAYDNPQTVVDTQSGNIWAQTIANIGKQTANVISKISERQSSEIKAAEKQRLADDKARAKYKQEIVARVEQYGGKSDSWYNMAYNDIDQKFNFQADLKAAKTAEQREAASKGVALYDQRIRTSVGGIKALDEFREIFAEDADLKHGVPGGSFTGDRKAKSEWSRGIGENHFLKNALIGRAVGEDGKLLPPVEFYQTDDGIIMGKLKGHADFNVIETINEPTVEIEDLDNGPDGISALWKKSGFTDNQGVIKPEYLGEKNMVPTTGKDGLITQTTTRQYKPEVLQALATQINTKAYGISDSVSTRDGYNDVNATFLEYGGRGDLDKNADFTLTDKGKEDFAKVILQHAGPSLIGTGELVESEVVEGRLTFDESKSNKTTIREEQAKFRDENKPPPKLSEKQKEVQGRYENLFTQGNVFNMPKNKSGVLMTSGNIEIPKQDTENYKAFANNLSELGYKIESMSEPVTTGTGRNKKEEKVPAGYFIQSKAGSGSADSKAFVVEFNKPISGKDFYRELLTSTGMPLSQVEEKLKKLMSSFTAYDKPSEKDLEKQKYDDKGVDGSGNEFKPNLPGT